MSHRNIEVVIGRLATDEALRRRFREAPEPTLRELAAQGLDLTQTEVASLLACGRRCIEAIGREIDPRLDRACLEQPAAVEAPRKSRKSRNLKKKHSRGGRR